MEQLTNIHRAAMKRAVELSEITHPALIHLIYLLEMAASGEDSAIFDPRPSNWRDTGVVIGICGKAPESLWECNPDDLPNEDKFSPTMIRIRLDIVANQEETARSHKVTTRTLQRWIKDGLPSYKMGRERYFLKRDVEEFAENKAETKSILRDV